MSGMFDNSAEVVEAIRTVRQARKYSPEPVSAKDLEKLLQVARWTGTSNRFGSEFDAAADGVAQAAAPAVIVYAAYALLGHPHLGLALMAALFASSTIRDRWGRLRAECRPPTIWNAGWCPLSHERNATPVL